MPTIDSPAMMRPSQVTDGYTRNFAKDNMRVSQPTLIPSKVYAITDSDLFTSEQRFAQIQNALRAGVSWVQYRDKSKDTIKRRDDASKLQALCKQFNAKLIINDDVELAQEIAAHGVHLGQSDLPIHRARKQLGDSFIIGATCHDSIQLAENAIEDGANYLAFGRFFDSNTKPDAPRAPLNCLTEAKKLFSVPIIAIGGINAENAEKVFTAGADSIAVCQNLFTAKDVYRHAKVLLDI